MNKAGKPNHILSHFIARECCVVNKKRIIAVHPFSIFVTELACGLWIFLFTVRYFYDPGHRFLFLAIVVTLVGHYDMFSVHHLHYI